MNTLFVPPWLNILNHQLMRSSYDDLKLCHHQLAVVYDAFKVEAIGRDVMEGLFFGGDEYELALSELALSMRLRFDPYHPFLTHHHPDLGRITLIHRALLPGPSQMFLRSCSIRHHGHKADDERLGGGDRAEEKLAIETRQDAEGAQETLGDSYGPPPPDCFDDPHGYLASFEKNFLSYPWLICGPSGVGKSTLLAQMLARYFSQRAVVIMDRYQELLGHNPHWTYLREQSTQSNATGRVNSRHLLEIAFKLGSGVLVFGEIRHREVESFIHGTLSGHDHIFGTFHAPHPRQLWARLAMIAGDRAVDLLKETIGAVFLAKKTSRVHEVSDLYLPPLDS